jgi:HK97 family phage major capsid protein
MKLTQHMKLALVAGLVLMAIAMAFGYHIPIEASSLGLLAIGDTENVGAEIKQLLQKQGENFEEFKRANDELLKAKADGKAVSDIQAKLSSIDAEFKKIGEDVVELTKKAARPQFTGDSKGMTPEQVEHKQALGEYLRKGITGNLSELERKALSSASDPDGGYLVDAEMDTEIDRIAATVSAMRSVANVRTIGNASYKKLVKTRGVSGGWLAESADSAESTEPQWSEIEIIAHTAYAEPWVPNPMLEDAFYDLESDLVAEAGLTLAETEGAAFITGNGVGKARGLAAYSTVANASYAWGSVGYIAAGASGAFTSSAPADKLVQLQHSLKSVYRPGAVFMMNDGTLATVRQMKDGSGAYYLWQPDALVGFGGRFLGSPVIVDDNFADIAANSLSIAYGNMKRAYTIVDRRGIAIIRDNVTKKGVTKFHISKRVGGGITNFEAVKLMKFAAS